MLTEMPPIPDFLRATDRSALSPAIKTRSKKKRRPPGWFGLTKAEQEGTADPVTLLLRRQQERDKKEKQAARFAALRERSKWK